MNVNNQPDFEAAGAGEAGGPTSYLDLANSLGHHPKSVGAALAAANADVDWVEALKVTAKASEEEEGNAGAIRARVAAFADSLEPKWFLVVMGHRLRVVYGWRVCRPLAEDGKRYACLMGDRNVSSRGHSVEPKLFTTGEEVGDQYKAFKKGKGVVATMAEIQTALEAGADLAESPGRDGTDPSEQRAWKALPVHPKIAALFIHHPTIREGIKILIRMCGLVPTAERTWLDSLCYYFRLASTEDPSAAGESLMTTDWVMGNPASSEALEDWYLSLCDLYAITTTASLPPPPVRYDPPQAAAAAAGVPPGVATPVGSEKLPYQRVYTQMELGRIYEFCGLEVPMDGDRTAEGLPAFWREFEKVRGKYHSARAHIESWFNHHWPKDAPRYQRFISPALLKNMVTLDFDGEDASLSYAKRNEGFSVFAVYPLADDMDPGSSRAKAKAYEDTMDNHRPGEREEMEGLSECRSAIPATRTEFWKWVQYFAAAVETIFGDDCPLLEYLDRMKELVCDDRMFRRHGGDDWKGYFWKYHIATREYFRPIGRLDYRLQPLIDLLNRMRQGIPVSNQEVPRELLSGPKARQAGGSGGGGSLAPVELRQQTPTASGADPPRSGEGSIARKAATAWGRQLGEAVKEATEAVEGAGKKWSMKTLYPNGIGEAFGDMKGLMKANKSGQKDPCPRLFTYGKCKVKKCNQSHIMEREPSGNQSRRFVDWVKGRCGAIKDSPGNV